jgi:hypothetical protein
VNEHVEICVRCLSRRGLVAVHPCIELLTCFGVKCAYFVPNTLCVLLNALIHAAQCVGLAQANGDPAAAVANCHGIPLTYSIHQFLSLYTSNLGRRLLMYGGGHRRKVADGDRRRLADGGGH